MARACLIPYKRVPPPAIPRQEKPLAASALEPAGLGDQASLSRTSCVGIYRRLARVPHHRRHRKASVWARFGPLQPRESSACKGLRAPPCGLGRRWKTKDSVSFPPGSKVIGPACEEWVLALKCLPELRGEDRGPGVRCGFGKSSCSAVRREQERVGRLLAVHPALRENPEAAREKRKTEIQSLNYKPSGTLFPVWPPAGHIIDAPQKVYHGHCN